MDILPMIACIVTLVLLPSFTEGISLQVPEIAKAFSDTRQDLIKQRIGLRNINKKVQLAKEAEEKAANAKIKPMVGEPVLAGNQGTAAGNQGTAAKPKVAKAKVTNAGNQATGNADNSNVDKKENPSPKASKYTTGKLGKVNTKPEQAANQQAVREDSQQAAVPYYAPEPTAAPLELPLPDISKEKREAVKPAIKSVPLNPPKPAHAHVVLQAHRPQDAYLRPWNVRDRVIL